MQGIGGDGDQTTLPHTSDRENGCLIVHAAQLRVSVRGQGICFHNVFLVTELVSQIAGFVVSLQKAVSVDELHRENRQFEWIE